MELTQAELAPITEKQKKYILDLSSETGIGLDSLNIGDINALTMRQAGDVIEYLLKGKASGFDTISYTYKLYLKGKTVEQISQTRSICERSICRHLITKALQDWPLRWNEIKIGRAHV